MQPSPDATETVAAAATSADAKPPIAPLSSVAVGRLDRPPAVGSRIEWEYAIPIIAFHVAALLAFLPWFFSWTGVVILVVGIYFYGGIGINICYHRLLTHRSFQVPLWLERFFAVVAICCLQDTPATWVATHRMHHNDADEQPDPHSPLVNFFWSHMGWLMYENKSVRSTSGYDRFARDVLRDPFYMAMERTPLYHIIYVVHAAIYYLVGLAVGRWTTGTWWGGVQFGASLFVWGVLLRTVCVWHISWSVNSLSHMFGYRSYETGEQSRNNWLVAFLTSGEGWHNNHHIDPASASNWHRWWEFDGMWVIIRSLEIMGLATKVVRPRAQRRVR